MPKGNSPPFPGSSAGVATLPINGASEWGIGGLAEDTRSPSALGLLDSIVGEHFADHRPILFSRDWNRGSPRSSSKMGSTLRYGIFGSCEAKAFSNQTSASSFIPALVYRVATCQGVTYDVFDRSMSISASRCRAREYPPSARPRSRAWMAS